MRCRLTRTRNDFLKYVTEVEHSEPKTHLKLVKLLQELEHRSIKRWLTYWPALTCERKVYFLKFCWICYLMDKNEWGRFSWRHYVDVKSMQREQQFIVYTTFYRGFGNAVIPFFMGPQSCSCEQLCKYLFTHSQAHTHRHT